MNSTFKRNTCEQSGPDIGGGAVRVLSQFHNQPVFVTNSRSVFAGYGNWSSNGGALSSIGVSWVILNTTITNNRAVGSGANPAQSGTPGGGSGGGIYLDGNLFSLRVVSSTISDNHANEGGGAVFFVSNDRTGIDATRALDPAPQPERRLRDRRLPGDLLPGQRPAPGRSTAPSAEAAGYSPVSLSTPSLALSADVVDPAPSPWMRSPW